MLTSVQGTGKNQLQPCQESVGDASVLSHCSLLRNPWPYRPVCWSIVANEKQTVGSPIIGALSSDRILKATKNVNATSWDRNFSHAEIKGNYTSEFLKQLISNLLPSLPQPSFKLQSNSHTHNRCVGTAIMLHNSNSVSNKSSSLQSSTAIFFINTAT
jgi:hypothetical protein